MGSPGIRLRRDLEGDVLVLRFHHPLTRNALDRATRAALVDELEAADADPGVRAVVLTGVDPAFTSGVDAKQLLGDHDYRPLPLDPATCLRAMSTPTIAAVNGACVSGGLEIALACSFVIASERALFADTHAALGLSPGWGLSVELPAAIGVHRARRMALTGEVIPAAVAERWGLVSEVVAHGDLTTRMMELAAAVARHDPRSVRHAVGLYRDGRDVVLAPAFATEQRALQEWRVDRDAAGGRFAQSVSPPST